MTLLQPAPEFLRGTKAPRVLMLLYHRVADLASDPQLLSVTPKYFNEHMQVLRKKYCSLKLEQLLESDSSRKSATNSIVVTFDDGYTDNLTNALPVLEKHEIPATVFVTTENVQERKHFWWDDLAGTIFSARAFPEELELRLEQTKHWIFPNIDHWNEHQFSNWNLLSTDDPTPRHHLYRDTSRFLRGATEDERQRVLESLRHWAGLSVTHNSACNALSEDELVMLANSNLIEIGSHTVNHPVLSLLPSAKQESELRDSKQYLETVIDREVTNFAYPYGTKSDYTSETVSLVKKVGYKSACTNIAEAIWAGSDRYQLPRLLVRDCDGDSFERWLGEWFGEA